MTISFPPPPSPASPEKKDLGFLSQDEYKYLTHLLAQESGLAITADKVYLVESRLTPIARKHGFRGLREFINKLQATSSRAWITEVVEAMQTHESSFFRDSRPFDQFKQVILPELLLRNKNTRTLRIWCAACSSGQEPYSLAMILADQKMNLQGWRVEIVGTDLCNDILTKARTGVYSQFEVQRGLPIQYLIKHFKQFGSQWQISDELKSQIIFREHNLLNDPSSLGKFDVIFCRNVLIYFDVDTKKKIFHKLHGALNEKGTLCLGVAETIFGISDQFGTMDNARGFFTKK